jgi:hypothetical protein
LRTVTARPAFPPCLLLAAFLILLPAAQAAAPPPENPHGHFKQPAQCARCHLYTDSKPDPDRFLTSSVDFCLECHLAEERGRTHPIKVHARSKVREIKVPPEFRLGDGEHLICLSCHSAHGPYVSNVRTFAGQAPVGSGTGEAAPYYRTYFLRRSNPAGEGFEALCGGCHRTP